MIRCARCGKWIEGQEIKFATEGEFMGKALCSKCKAKVHQISRNKYRAARAKMYPGDPYEKNVY